ncbi:hypothetical protein LSH36_548g01004 [Paralvinella palmiformis]|uniref:Cytochrome P450 n=1 Tax=Paralvinella palmiformis TaxID=53620 RepID=A0AAD9J6U6_9ANNE|nr:hypothetical protein LSH36_548g01004 [Paralvinella palmiformis]
MLALGTWFLLLTATVLGIIYFLMATFSRKRRPGEPVVVKGSLLWGSAGDFSTHAVNFLHKCQKTYGDCFTIRLINQYLTIIMDPHSFEAMSKEKNFDFDPIQKQVNWNVFGFVLKDPRKMIKETGKTVRGPNNNNNNNHNNNGSISCQSEARRPYGSDGLRAFTSKTLFNAIFNTVFGNSDDHPFNSNMAYKNFDIFHKFFNYFWLGVPKFLFPQAIDALKELLVMPESEELLARNDVADYIKMATNYMKEQGQTEADIKGHHLVYLHVNYNTFRIAFWVLSNLLEHPESYAALKDEVTAAIDEKLDPSTNTASFTGKEIESLQILDSVITETMRLSSGVFVVRYITKDTQFTTTDGQTYLMREGDRIALYPPAIHKDPEIFEDPLEFKYDRFVGATFFKNGKELMNPVTAFGSLCPGRRFALLQLKWFIVSVVRRFHLRLLDGEHAEYAYEYHGHEVLPPKKDVQVEFWAEDDGPVILYSDE